MYPGASFIDGGCPGCGFWFLPNTWGPANNGGGSSCYYALANPCGKPPANKRPSDCRYVDSASAAVDVTFKFGPAVEAGNLSVGLNMFTKTYGEEGVGSSVELGFKDILSVQGTRDNAWASGPLSWSATVVGFNKDLNTPLLSSSGWKFQPFKEFRFGLQALLGVEFGLNTDRYKQTVNQNAACGYYDHN